VAQRERREREANEARPQRPKPLKLHVPLYKGGDSQNLPRWFVSVMRAIFAQQITDEHLASCTSFCLRWGWFFMENDCRGPD
jgi:hypothetical protein